MPYVEIILAINDTTAEVFIDDLGISIPYGESRSLFSEFAIEELHSSNDLKAHILAGNIIINDGSKNLGINDGIAHVSLESEYTDREAGVQLIIKDNGVPLTTDVVSLDFIGADTISYDTTSGDVQINIATPEFAYVQNQVIQDTNTATPTPIEWNYQLALDSGFIHSTTVNNTRVYVTRNAIYNISAQLNVINTVNTEGNVRLRARVNGIEYLDYTTAYAYVRKKNTAPNSTVPLVCIRELQVNDYVEIVGDRVGFTGTVNTVPNESTFLLEFIRKVT